MSEKQIKVCIVCHDLSLGAVLAALLLGRALSGRCRVEIAGSLFGKQLWPRLRETDLPVRVVPGRTFPAYLGSLYRLLRDTDADLIIAQKPRLPSYGLALLAKRLRRIPVILYIDDDELAMTSATRRKSLFRQLRVPQGYLYTRWMYRLQSRADAVICGSEYFRARHGGVVVPLGRDPAEFEPARFDREQIRAEHGLGDHELVIAFTHAAPTQGHRRDTRGAAAAG